MAQTDAGGEGTPTPTRNPGGRRPDNGLRGRADFTGNDSEDTPSGRNTRFIDTTLGILSYAQLAPHLAERVAKVSVSIAEGEFATWPLDETFILEIHRRICGDLVPEYAGRWRTAEVRVGVRFRRRKANDRTRPLRALRPRPVRADRDRDRERNADCR